MSDSKTDSFYLDKWHISQIKKISQRTGQSKSEIIRECIELRAKLEPVEDD